MPFSAHVSVAWSWHEFRKQDVQALIDFIDIWLPNICAPLLNDAGLAYRLCALDSFWPSKAGMLEASDGRAPIIL